MGKGQIVDTEYTFLDDQLWLVAVRFALESHRAEGPDKEGALIIREIINKKYVENKDVREKLQRERITINMHPLETGEITVTYSSEKVKNRAHKAKAKRKQEEKATSLAKRRDSKRFKEVEESEVGDAL